MIVSLKSFAGFLSSLGSQRIPLPVRISELQVSELQGNGNELLGSLKEIVAVRGTNQRHDKLLGCKSVVKVFCFGLIQIVLLVSLIITYKTLNYLSST